MTEQPKHDPFDRVVTTAIALAEAERELNARIANNSNALVNYWRPVIVQIAQDANQKLIPVGLRFYDISNFPSGTTTSHITIKARSSITDMPINSLRFGIDAHGSFKAEVSPRGLDGFPVIMNDDAIKSGQIAEVMADYAEKTLIKTMGSK